MAQQPDVREPKRPFGDGWWDTNRSGYTMMFELSRGMWSGLAWYEAWIKMWTAAFDPRRADDLSEGRSSEPSRAERRAAGLPWVPQLDAKVIPLRRATDSDGTEASRISLRMAVPTLFAGLDTANVICFETIMPMQSAQPRAQPQTDKGSPVQSPSRRALTPQADDAAPTDDDVPSRTRASRNRRPSR